MADQSPAGKRQEVSKQQRRNWNERDTDQTEGNRHKATTNLNTLWVLAELLMKSLRKKKRLTSKSQEREFKAADTFCIWWECQWKNAYVKVIVFEVGLLELLVDSKGISHEGCRSSQPLFGKSSWWTRTEAIRHWPLQAGSKFQNFSGTFSLLYRQFLNQWHHL